MHACGPTGPAAENRRRASGPVANVMPCRDSGQIRPYQLEPGHDIGRWPAGPTAIFSRRASRATSMHFLLARWATRQQIGPPVGLEDTGPTPLVALFAKPTQTTDSHQCIDGYLSPWGSSAWLCLALSLMTQLTAQSIMWLPDTATRLECIVYSAVQTLL